MSLFPLFARESNDELAPQAARLAPKLHALAERGVYFGTSSWKYEGWLGSIYQPNRYLTRGKFSRKKFEEECLAEYAATFPVVCGDFAFYQFPSPEYWKRLFDGSPSSLLFAFKVPEDITVARWPTHARYGTRAGKENEGFLRSDLFKTLFVRRLEPYRERVASLIFEFGTFPKSTFPEPDAFLARLEPFLQSLPRGLPCGIEIRNPEYLTPSYLSMLATYNVAHVFNAWTRMPELGTQVNMPGTFTTDFTIVRALLKHGRGYADAVQAFEPYQLIQEPNEPVRAALARIADHALQKNQKAYIFVNNRLEGNAPSSIEHVIAKLDRP